MTAATFSRTTLSIAWLDAMKQICRRTPRLERTLQPEAAVPTCPPSVPIEPIAAFRSPLLMDAAAFSTASRWLV